MTLHGAHGSVTGTSGANGAPRLECDGERAAWIAADADTVRAVLEHPALGVRPADAPVPPGLVGTRAGEVFAAFVRMSDGEAHRRRREAVEKMLAGIPVSRVVAATRAVLAAGPSLPALHALQFEVPVAAIGYVLGVPLERSGDLVAWTRALVRAAAPEASEEELAAGTAAAPRLVGLLEDAGGGPGLKDGQMSPWERLANMIGFLFQTHDATAGLIGNAIVALMRDNDADVDTVLREVVLHDAPVRSTRRFAHATCMIGDRPVRAGDAVIVEIGLDVAASGRSFAYGHGVHRCPGEAFALVIAREVVAFAKERGMIPESGSGEIPCHPSVNVRIPDLRLVSSTREA